MTIDTLSPKLRFYSWCKFKAKSLVVTKKTKLNRDYASCSSSAHAMRPIKRVPLKILKGKNLSFFLTKLFSILLSNHLHSLFVFQVFICDKTVPYCIFQVLDLCSFIFSYQKRVQNEFSNESLVFAYRFMTRM